MFRLSPSGPPTSRPSGPATGFVGPLSNAGGTRATGLSYLGSVGAGGRAQAAGSGHQEGRLRGVVLSRQGQSTDPSLEAGPVTAPREGVGARLPRLLPVAGARSPPLSVAVALMWRCCPDQWLL